ncbi:MAG TPA: hypothetical protein ENH85_10315 [Candidatus Scalindua sp.]|nr:hypothetical protein [Candidatus Scalindua sp.]
MMDDYLEHGFHEERMRKMELEKELLLIEKLKPKFSRDGNQYCYLYGDNLQDGIAGFGDTVSLAVTDFYNSFYRETIINQAKHKE